MEHGWLTDYTSSRWPSETRARQQFAELSTRLLTGFLLHLSSLNCSRKWNSLENAWRIGKLLMTLGGLLRLCCFTRYQALAQESGSSLGSSFNSSCFEAYASIMLLSQDCLVAQKLRFKQTILRNQDQRHGTNSKSTRKHPPLRRLNSSSWKWLMWI